MTGLCGYSCSRRPPAQSDDAGNDQNSAHPKPEAAMKKAVLRQRNMNSTAAISNRVMHKFSGITRLVRKLEIVMRQSSIFSGRSSSICCSACSSEGHAWAEPRPVALSDHVQVRSRWMAPNKVHYRACAAAAKWEQHRLTMLWEIDGEY